MSSEKMHKDRLLLLGSAFESIDSNYATHWDNESQTWNAGQVYKKIADEVELKKGDVHLDVGSGNGRLLMELKEQQPNSALIGIDNNVFLSDTSVSRMQQRGMKAISHKLASLQVEDQHMVSLKYHAKALQVPPEEITQPSDTVHVILDDIRTREVLNVVLGNKQIDSASFTFPGMSNTHMNVAPYRLDDKTTIKIIRGEDIEAARKRKSTIAEDVRKQTYSTVSKYMKTGGVFVLSERIAMLEGLISNPIEGFRIRFGKMAKYWIPASEAVSEFQVRNTNQDFEWQAACIDGVIREASKISADMRLVIIKLLRNEVPFEEDDIAEKKSQTQKKRPHLVKTRASKNKAKSKKKNKRTKKRRKKK